MEALLVQLVPAKLVVEGAVLVHGHVVRVLDQATVLDVELLVLIGLSFVDRVRLATQSSWSFDHSTNVVVPVYGISST